MTGEKIELNKGYMSIQTAFEKYAASTMTEENRKIFKEGRARVSQAAYEDIKQEFLTDHDIRKFVTNISGNSYLVIRCCFNDTEFIKSLSPDVLRMLVINCFCHEGFNVPRVRQRMRTIVKKDPEQFSDEIIAEFNK